IRLFRPPPPAGVRPRFEVRNARLLECDGRSTHHPARPAPARADLGTDVLVDENVPVKKGQPLFQFDRRPYEYKVAQISAQLAEAKQNVIVLKADIDIATQKTTRTKVELG